MDRKMQKFHSNTGILTPEYALFTTRSKFDIRKLIQKSKNVLEGKDSGWSWMNRDP